MIEYYYNKPLNECRLEEVIEGVVINANMSHWFDTADYTDDGSHYTLKVTHSIGINASKSLELLIQSVFMTYGASFKSTISEKTFFMKIFKIGHD